MFGLFGQDFDRQALLAQMRQRQGGTPQSAPMTQTDPSKPLSLIGTGGGLPGDSPVPARSNPFSAPLPKPLPGETPKPTPPWSGGEPKPLPGETPKPTPPYIPPTEGGTKPPGSAAPPLYTPGMGETAVDGAPAPKDGGPFQSKNASVSGYVQDAINDFASKVQAIPDEAGRKAAVEEYLRSLVPEIEARGGKVGSIKGEKIQIDGKWVDTLRDIEGAAAPQYLVEDGSSDGGGGNGPVPMLPGGDGGGVPSMVPMDMRAYQQLQQRLQDILGGPQAFDRQALLAQMMK